MFVWPWENALIIIISKQSELQERNAAFRVKSVPKTPDTYSTTFPTAFLLLTWQVSPTLSPHQNQLCSLHSYWIKGFLLPRLNPIVMLLMMFSSLSLPPPPSFFIDSLWISHYGPKSVISPCPFKSTLRPCNPSRLLLHETGGTANPRVWLL